jgi:rare lipoprotein A
MNKQIFGLVFILLMQRMAQGQVLQGRCSYYAHSFHGRPMACGGKYDTSAYTAAHRFLPCGTIIKVKNLANQKWILLRVSDRGPYSKTLILDISKPAAKYLDMFKVGVIRAQIEVVALPEKGKRPEFVLQMGQD